MNRDDESRDDQSRGECSKNLLPSSTEQSARDADSSDSSHTSISSISSSRSLDKTQEDSAVTADSVSELASSISGEPTVVDTDSLTATLLGVPRVKIRDFVYEHRLDETHAPDETRQVALFDVHNTGEYPLRWQAQRTQFIGDDEYTYRTATLSLDPERLGPGCHTRQVSIQPRRKARVVTLVEELPAGVHVDEVIQTVVSRGHSTNQRLSFTV